jgi:hypothetical protein
VFEAALGSGRRGWRGTTTAFVLLFLMALMLSPAATAKTIVDFDPNLDFAKFRTFTYLGGVEHLALLPLNPDQIKDEIHAAVARELGKRGLKEVPAQENPDLAVRYWANTNAETNYAPTGNWNGFALFIGDYWAYTYDLLNARNSEEGSILIDLIDVKGKNLAWRLYLEQKILNVNDVWKKVNEEISKAFTSFPPTEKEKEEKRRERAKHPPKPPQS